MKDKDAKTQIIKYLCFFILLLPWRQMVLLNRMTGAMALSQ
jgi:hypothetical protein